MDKIFLTGDSTKGLRKTMTGEQLINMPDPAGEFHTSIYYYGPEMIVHMQEHNGSTGDYTGPVYGNSFVIDIDVEGDLQTAVKTWIRIYQFLSLKGVMTDNFYSGMKGFHIYVPKHYVEYPPELESKWNVASMVFAKWVSDNVEGTADYIDWQIYTKVHNIRLPYSVHPGSNNRKTSFTYTETILMEDGKIDLNKTLKWNITEKDQIKRRIFEGNIHVEDDWIPPIDISEFYSTLKTKPERMQTRVGKTVDYKNTYGKKLCILNMKEDKDIEGRRNAIILRLISYYKEECMSFEETDALIRKWNDTLQLPIEDSVANPELTKYLERGYEAGYIYTCKDDIKMSYCSSQCFFFKTRNADNEETILRGGQMSKAVKRLHSMPHEGVINLSLLWTGLRKATINPELGQVLTICAASGAGKTTILLNIVLFFRSVNFLFFSYDMTKDEIAERMAIMLDLDVDNNEEHAKQFDDLTKHIDIVDDCELDVDAAEAYVMKLSKDTGKKYGAVIWDFLDYVPAEIKSNKGDTERNSYIAKRIRQLGKDTKTAQIILVQVPKEKGGLGNIKIGMDAPMNAGNITNISHLLITAWRPGKGNSLMEDNIMVLYPAKHRSGKSDYEVRCSFQGDKYRIRNMEV